MLNSLRGAFGSVVSRFCLVHFLAIVNNKTIRQKSSLHAFCFRRCPCVWKQFAAVVSVVACRSLFLGAKL